MSRSRYARRSTGKADVNEGVIVEALKRAGCFVWSMERPADLLVGHKGTWHVLEVKRDAKAARAELRPVQKELIALATGGYVGPVHVVTTPEEALAAVGISVIG